MISTLLASRANRLFLVLSGIFISNALIAEFIGGKIFSLERTLGMDPVSFSLLGEAGLSFQLTAGVLLWPVVFIMTDIINEYYGVRGVRFLSYLTVGLIVLAFGSVYGAIQLVPAEWWVGVNAEKGVPDMQKAFAALFGQGLWIILGSITAFLVGQLLDVAVFHRIKQWTGEGKIWLRATGSTLVSQWVDSFVVIFIAFYIGQGWSFPKVLAIAMVGYAYKFVVALLATPLIYGVHALIEGYLGETLAADMKKNALQDSAGNRAD